MTGIIKSENNTFVFRMCVVSSTNLFPTQEFADLAAAFDQKFWSPQHQKTIEIHGTEIISDGVVIERIETEGQLLYYWNEYLYQLQEGGS